MRNDCENRQPIINSMSGSVHNSVISQDHLGDSLESQLVEYVSVEIITASSFLSIYPAAYYIINIYTTCDF